MPTFRSYSTIGLTRYPVELSINAWPVMREVQGLYAPTGYLPGFQIVMDQQPSGGVDSDYSMFVEHDDGSVQQLGSVGNIPGVVMQNIAGTTYWEFTYDGSLRNLWSHRVEQVGILTKTHDFKYWRLRVEWDGKTFYSEQVRIIRPEDRNMQKYTEVRWRHHGDTQFSEGILNYSNSVLVHRAWLKGAPVSSTPEVNRRATKVGGRTVVRGGDYSKVHTLRTFAPECLADSLKLLELHNHVEWKPRGINGPVYQADDVSVDINYSGRPGEATLTINFIDRIVLETRQGVLATEPVQVSDIPVLQETTSIGDSNSAKANGAKAPIATE